MSAIEFFRIFGVDFGDSGINYVGALESCRVAINWAILTNECVAKSDATRNLALPVCRNDKDRR